MHLLESARGRIHSDRRYHFDATRDSVWAALSEVARYPTWLPWLQEFTGTELVAGADWECEVHPPLPFSLRFTVTLTEVAAPSLVRASVAGDVCGVARLELEDDPEGCSVRVVSEVAPSNTLLRALGFLGRPLARLGHDWVLDTGADQFSRRAL
jgi:uncharacterized protein YndB with AHSA1/START domain